MSTDGQLERRKTGRVLSAARKITTIPCAPGVKLQGQIESFDQYVVLLRNTVTQMVYKHAISTVVPGRPVNFHAVEPTDPA